MSELAVNKDALRSAAKKMDAFAGTAFKVRSDAHEADIDDSLWGMLGSALGLPGKYGELAESIYTSLDQIAEFLGKSSMALDRSAENYHAADEAILKHLAEVAKKLDELGSV